MDYCITESLLGTIELQADVNGLTSVCFTESQLEITKDIPGSLLTAVLQLQEYFDGNRTHFELKLNPNGTDFQHQVWTIVNTIPFGETISYAQISKLMQKPNAVRAIANAIGKNPLLVIVPCHRVIGSDGNLTGYAGGIPRKQSLLSLEKPSIQHELF